MFRKKGKKDKIFLITPISKGFPITDFNVAPSLQYIITGNAFGCVAAYKLPDRNSDPNSEEKEEYKVHFLDEHSEEAIRYVFVKEVKTPSGESRTFVGAVVGFWAVRWWNFIKTGQPGKVITESNKSLFRFPFRGKPTDRHMVRHNGRLKFFCADSKKVASFDLDRLAASPSDNRADLQGIVQMDRYLHKRTTPVSYDEQNYVFLTLDDKTGTRHVEIKNAHSFELKDEMNFVKSHVNYWGFQLHGDKMAYVSNNDTVKIYCLEKQEVIHKYKKHKGYIIAIWFDGTTVVSMGTDKKIKIWRDGRKIYSVSNVEGEFNPGYLYKVMLVGRDIFYSADNGLYMVALGDFS